MKAVVSLSLLAITRTALAHGNHAEHVGPKAGETIQQYAQRHMSSEHHMQVYRAIAELFPIARLESVSPYSRNTLRHIDSVKIDSNGYWEREEIEAVYGVHHVYSTKKSKDEIAHQEKANHIVDTVLKTLDLDNDGRVSAFELKTVGLDGLPNFDNLGAEGHHYDVESEFFLHHEEQFHSTPETQTDESYNHPEDLEHFAAHESIERAEAEKEAKFQGITVDEVLKEHEHVDTPPATTPEHNDSEAAVHPHGEQIEAVPPAQEPPVPKVTRTPPPEKQDPSIRFKGASAEAKRKGEWGTGEDGYKAPREASDKMRKNLPYKERMQYKFRRNWGDF
ncbi:hypothetical protein H0H87_006962 [Tephrocybe sp. NHM501043]|nr:hypothetical protein H0H87_006962 [Tephrocybe sp. NHM501043]